MARPGFVLEVDDRTPPLVVHSGASIQLERLPLGSKVVYPADSLSPVADLSEAISAALDAPLGSEPLRERLTAGMSLTIAFDDNTRPSPRMRRPDVRGKIIEAVLTRAAQAGVDDVVLLLARGLHRRLGDAELEHLLGERVHRSFSGSRDAGGQLVQHDAEDTENLTVIGSTAAGEVAVNSRAVASDLLVTVSVVDAPGASSSAGGGGAAGIATGLGSTATICQISSLPGLRSGGAAAAEIAALVEKSVTVFAVEVVLDSDLYVPPLEFLGKREWEWTLKDRVSSVAFRRGQNVTSAKVRQRTLARAEGGFRATAVNAGAIAEVNAASRQQVLAQQVVEVTGQADVAIVGVPERTPYSVDSSVNPILAAWSGIGQTLQAHTGQPVVRQGGAAILYHPLRQEFSPLHHPSYVDFFADVLAAGEAMAVDQLHSDFESKYATDPWYSHLYRTSYAFHGVHPFHRWYEIAEAAQHYSDIVWVGADRASVERLGFRAASTLADALEIVSHNVGRSPQITYLHTPAQLTADVR